MPSDQTLNVAKRATELYENQLREDLERTHLNEFVAIEPDSGEYFLGSTLSEAIQAARRHYPDRITFAVRVGASSAVHLGSM
jgi:hypothetical protein